MSVEPSSTARGSSTRPSSMSGSIDSSPTPTVKTGTPAAWSGRSASVSGRSSLSAPSETSTRPDSGTLESSSRAASSAWPSRVCVPSKVSSSSPSIRSATSEKRKKRRTKRSESCSMSGLSPGVNASATKALRAVPSRFSSSMLRESSIRTPTKFCCGTTVESTSVGCMRQKTSTPRSATRSAAMMPRSATELRPRAIV